MDAREYEIEPEGGTRTLFLIRTPPKVLCGVPLIFLLSFCLLGPTTHYIHAVAFTLSPPPCALRSPTSHQARHLVALQDSPSF